MSKFWLAVKRYLGKLGLWGVGTILVGGAIRAIEQILPLTGYQITQGQARVLFWASIVILLVGVSLIIAALVKHTPKRSQGIRRGSLADTLTAMHRRLVELQKEKASHTKLSYTQWSKVMPTLADRMGIVKLKDWYEFERKAKSRIRRAIPRQNFKRQTNPKRRFTEFLKWKDKAYRVALYVALQLKDEMLKSREWTFDDGIKASDWLDGYGWGVKKVRDDDPQWRRLFELISNDLKKDDALRDLIKKHIDFSLMCNNIRLLTYYASKFKDDVFSLMLYEGLLGSPISPEEVEIALSEILGAIDKRLREIKNE